VSKTVGLLIHLPQGEARCIITPVDLTLGRLGNKLSGEVRSWGNTSKKAFDIAVDLAAEPVVVETKAAE
jgi:hypothetical protein